MVYSSKLIDKSLIKNAQLELKKLGRYSMLPIKLKSIIACQDSPIKHVAKTVGFSDKSLIEWIKAFKKNGIKGLYLKQKTGRNSLLNDDIKLYIAQTMQQNPSITINLLKTKIAKKFDLDLSKSTVHRAMKEVGYSYITPRKQHYLQNKEKLDEFKKNSCQ